MTEDNTAKQVAERLGFFFSNANLRMDRFLRREVLNEENNGYVTIETLLKFNTIKNITTDTAIIAKAAKEVSRPLLKLNDDETSICRVEKFTEAMMDDNVKVTLRVSNIPIKGGENDADYTVSRDEFGDLFKEYGDVAMIRLLKSKLNGNPNRVAVGRAFVEYHTVEDMEKAVADLCTEDPQDANLKPKKVLTLGDNELKVKTMQQWLDKKQAQRGEKFPNGDNKKSKFEQQEKKKAEAGEDKATLEAIEFKMDWKPGCVIQLKGLPSDCDREAILSAVKGFIGDDVNVRADYSRGMKDGAIRFDEPNEKIATLATELGEGKVTIGVEKVESATLLEGDEEKKYYEDYIAFRTKQMRANAEEKLQRKKKQRGRRN
mmetsp:Transcript_31697/g.36971  ORF Transcript_31697/g.36971 Transcript_31697/m.36971 type:complete len:375 (-) Transcript_31697:53-1177(-)